MALRGPRKAGRRDKRRASVLRSKTLAQGEFTSPEQFNALGAPRKACLSWEAGQNARLAAKLTGWKIDIKPESAPEEEFEAVEAE